jgi:hypothetical protein
VSNNNHISNFSKDFRNRDNKSSTEEVKTSITSEATNVTVEDKSVKTEEVSQAIHVANPAAISVAERISNEVISILSAFERAKIGSAEKVKAWERLIGFIKIHPKKIILDKVLEFFIKHKDDPMLSETNALQGIAALDKTYNLRAKILYDVMINIANHTASPRTISLEMIRNIFRSDDFVNWIAFKIDQR